MKIFGLERGDGKTIRMLYASEYQNIPILCHSEIAKKCLTERAKALGINIPEPISVNELSDAKTAAGTGDLLVDDIPLVLQAILNKIGSKYNVCGGTFTLDNHPNAERETIEEQNDN